MGLDQHERAPLSYVEVLAVRIYEARRALAGLRQMLAEIEGRRAGS